MKILFSILFIITGFGLSAQSDADYSWLKIGEEKTATSLTFLSRKDPHLDPVNFAYLDGLVDALKEKETLSLNIKVWTGSKGKKKKNEILSNRRADIICWYLIGAGISPSRLTAEGMGESDESTVVFSVNQI